MQKFLDACIKANQEIYEYLNTSLSLDDYSYTQTIGAGGDKSLKIDIICENIFIKHLSIFGDIYSEEIGYLKTSKNFKEQYIITIDPLDGSSNFISNIPYYGTSVAIEVNGKVFVSCICNLNEASLVYKLDEKVHRVDLFTLENRVYLEQTTTNIGIFERAYKRSDICGVFFEKNIKYRSLGAIALSLCMAHSCKFVMFAGKIRDFDVKAALHICEDLHISISPEFLIVSKSSTMLEQIKEIINE